MEFKFLLLFCTGGFSYTLIRTCVYMNSFLSFGWVDVSDLLHAACFQSQHMKHLLRSCTRHLKITSGLSNLSFLVLVLASHTMQGK